MHKLLKEEVLNYLKNDNDEFAVILLHKEWNIDKDLIRNEIFPFIKDIANEGLSNVEEEDIFYEGYSAGIEDAEDEIKSIRLGDGNADIAYKNWKKTK